MTLRSRQHAFNEGYIHHFETGLLHIEELVVSLLSLLSPVLDQSVQRPATANQELPGDQDAQDVVELFAGAPDWLFGRACVKHVVDMLPLLVQYSPLLQVLAGTLLVAF